MAVLALSFVMRADAFGKKRTEGSAVTSPPALTTDAKETAPMADGSVTNKCDSPK